MDLYTLVVEITELVPWAISLSVRKELVTYVAWLTWRGKELQDTLDLSEKIDVKAE
jgi:hypothetical protein